MEDVETTLMNVVVNGTLKDVQDTFAEFKVYNAPDDSYFDYELLKAAIRRRNTDIVLFLINFGCRVKNPTKNGCEDTPLHLVMLMNNEILRKHKETSNSTIRDWLNFEVIVSRTLHRGASIYDKNANGDTPLYAAFKDAVDKNEQTNLWALFKIVRFNFKPTNMDDLLHFHIACATVDHRTVKRYLKCRFNPNKPMRLNVNEYDGLNPIQYSIKNNNFDFFKILIKYADFSVKDDDGLTYLHMIYYSYYPETSSSWIKKAFRKRSKKIRNLEDKYGLSHFHLSCTINDPLVVQTFINSGVDVNSCVAMEAQINPGFTPLHFAVESSNEEVVDVLLKAGADPNKADKRGMTPLHLACKKSKTSRIKRLLLKCKANPTIADSEGFTPLHVLIYNAKRDRVPILNKAMSKAQWGSFNYEDNYGLSFFHIACTTKRVRRVKMFLDSGVNINSRVHSGKYSGFTALHFAVTYNQKAVVEFLLKRNANINAKLDASEFTPLHLACEYIHYRKTGKEKRGCKCRSNQMDIIKLLLLRGAQVDAKDSSGITPLLHTCVVVKNSSPLSYSSTEERYKVRKETETRLRETIEILIANKANIKSRTSNQSSILHIFSECENIDISEGFIEFLINSGADVNAVDDAGLTPLHIAAQCVNENMIKSLLKHNANPNIKCKRSRAPLHISAEEVAKVVNNWDSVFIIEELLNYGADINVNDTYLAYLLHFENSEKPTLGYGKLLRSIFIHVQKLLALKLPVSQTLHKYCIQFHEVFKHDYLLSDPDAINCTFIKIMDRTIDRCLDELNKMKKIKLDRYTSFHDILLKDPHELATHVKNRRLNKIIKDTKEFPLYSALLKLQFKKGLMRSQALESAKEALTYVLNINLPDSCIVSILKKLENEEIVNLKEAASVKVTRKKN